MTQPVPQTIPTSKEETYPLSHDHLSTVRLIAQHELWQQELRFLLHPTIASSLDVAHERHQPPDVRESSEQEAHSQPKLRVADLATGTAIWALSLLRERPNIDITASDISLAQAPPPEWLPERLKLREWDIYSPVPDEWKDQFDVVHIRLALLVVRNNDAESVLKRAWQMLKPGGWMQWDELDVEGAEIVVADSAAVDEDDIRGFKAMQELASFEGLKWPRRLEEDFRGAGFENVGKEVFRGEKSLRWFFQSMQFMVMEEETRRRGGKGREDVMRDVEGGLVMSRKGVARVVPKIVVCGQKPGDCR